MHVLRVDITLFLSLRTCEFIFNHNMKMLGTSVPILYVGENCSKYYLIWKRKKSIMIEGHKKITRKFSFTDYMTS